MMLSVYVTLGIFLLLAARNPSANRSLIAFTAWSSIAHAAVMAVQSFYMASERGELLFAVAKRNVRQIPKTVAGLQVTRIGEITLEKHIVLRREDGTTESLKNKGWDPFR